MSRIIEHILQNRAHYNDMFSAEEVDRYLEKEAGITEKFPVTPAPEPDNSRKINFITPGRCESIVKVPIEIEVEVLVEYSYQPAGGDGWNEPGYDEAVEIHSVTPISKDISQEIDVDVFSRLELACLEDAADTEDMAACEAAEWRRCEA